MGLTEFRKTHQGSYTGCLIDKILFSGLIDIKKVYAPHKNEKLGIVRSRSMQIYTVSIFEPGSIDDLHVKCIYKSAQSLRT